VETGLIFGPPVTAWAPQLGVWNAVDTALQGRINHWANRANARGLAFLGASRLNTKTLLYCFFMFLGCSPRVKVVVLLITAFSIGLQV